MEESYQKFNFSQIPLTNNIFWAVRSSKHFTLEKRNILISRSSLLVSFEIPKMKDRFEGLRQQNLVKTRNISVQKHEESYGRDFMLHSSNGYYSNKLILQDFHNFHLKSRCWFFSAGTILSKESQTETILAFSSIFL